MTPKIKSGTYLYTMNDVEVVREPWRIESHKDGRRTVTSSRISETFGIQIDLIALETKDVSKYDFTFTDLNAGKPVACGFYKVEPEGVVFRSTEFGEWEPVSCASYFFPLMRIFTGALVRQVISMGGQADIIVPDIRNPANTETLFKPLKSRREVNADPTQENLFHYLGGHYETAVPVTLNDDGLMMHYTWTTPDGAKWICQNCIQS